MDQRKTIELDAALQARLMLVDDETDFREIMEKRLAKKGAKLAVAECCRTALELLEERVMDVIIMDVSMPEIDGIECLKRVKARWPEIEVIILTGHASVKSGIEGMQGGAFDYCLKPIDVQELLEKIELAARKALINRE